MEHPVSLISNNVPNNFCKLETERAILSILQERVAKAISNISFLPPHIQTRIKEGVNPPEGSERDIEFEKNKGYLRDVVKGVISRRREGLGGEHVPFIDNLLQSGVPDEQVYLQ